MSQRGLVHILVLSSVAFWCIQCATPGSPSGGPKDATPPGVVDDESSPNPALNFDADEIVITFDEWIQLNNPASQMIISPPIDPRPVPRLSRKSVVIPIERENLRDSTTYILNFGESIQDITERNSPRNLTYVFSTGPFVDSLSIQGEVYDAFTGDAMENVKVILHTTDSDTSIFRSLPAYFATTDSSGVFDLGYLRADTFWLYAVYEEGFGNFKHDDGEPAGFMADPIVLSPGVDISVSIPIFQTQPPILMITMDRRTGPQKAIFNRVPGQFEPRGYPEADHWSVSQDTVIFWYTGSDSIDVELLENGAPFDTIRLFPFSDASSKPFVEVPKKKRHPEEPISIYSSEPISRINNQLITVRRGDTAVISQAVVSVDTLDPQRLVLGGTKWDEKSSYSITMLPRALETTLNVESDSVIMGFIVDERVNFGLLNLTIAALDSTANYVVEVLDGQEKILQQRIVDVSTTLIEMPNLEAKEYVVHIIEDTNGNGQWDTGSLREKRQPERIFIESVVGMRPGWDLDYTINWSD